MLLNTGVRRTVPDKKAIFQNAETEIGTIKWSNAYELIIVGCQGSFIYFKGNVALIRAYSLDGKEKWTLRRPLPKPNKPEGLHAGFTGISAKINLFLNGRYALVGGDHSTFEVINVKNGEVIVSLSGWPIATSDRGARALIRTDSTHIKLVDLQMFVQPGVYGLLPQEAGEVEADRGR